MFAFQAKQQLQLQNLGSGTNSLAGNISGSLQAQ
jgi:hypothetical protein